MKKKTRKILRIVTTTLFTMATILIIYESLCPANMSIITPVSQGIINIFDKIFPAKEIPLQRVTILDKNDTLIADDKKYIKFEVYPENATNPEIAFENLTPDYYTFRKSEASIVLHNLDNEIQPQDVVGKLKAYSVANPEIYDIYEFKIHKIFPNDFVYKLDASLTDEATQTYNTYVNEEIRGYSFNPETGQPFSDGMFTSPINFDYNPNYISRTSNASFYPTKTGKTQVKAYYRDNPEKYTLINLNVLEREKLNRPVKVVPYVKNADKRTYQDDGQLKFHETYNFEFRDENDNRVNVPFTFSEDTDYFNNVMICRGNRIKVEQQGDIKIKLDLHGDYEGETFEQTFYGYHIINPPKIDCDLLDKETNLITLEKLSSVRINVTFPTGTTYTKFTGYSYNPEIVKVINNSGITLDAIGSGKTTIVIQPVDEYAKEFGFEPIKIKVNVTKPGIEDDFTFQLRFRKGMGHMTGFLIDSVLFLLMIYYWLDGKKRFRWMLSGIPIGFGFAGLSELLQMTQPSRGPSFMDVCIDYIGWIIGFAITFVVLLAIILIKRKKDNKLTKSCKSEIKEEE